MPKSAPSGPDPLRLLPMLLPNMDPSAKRMCSILLKFRELMELMEPPEASADTGPDTGPEDSELMHQLQEGLTPEQQNMITSLTSMLKS